MRIGLLLVMVIGILGLLCAIAAIYYYKNADQSDRPDKSDEESVTSKQNVSMHTSKILKEQELDENSVVKDYLTTASDGKEYMRSVFNLIT